MNKKSGLSKSLLYTLSSAIFSICLSRHSSGFEAGVSTQNFAGFQFATNPLQSELSYPGRFVGVGADFNSVNADEKEKLSDAAAQRNSKESAKSLEAIVKSDRYDPLIKVTASQRLMWTYRDAKEWSKMKTLAEALSKDDFFPARDRAYLALSEYYRFRKDTKQSQACLKLSSRYGIVGENSAVMLRAMALCREDRSVEAEKLLRAAKPDSDAKAISVWHCLAVIYEGNAEYDKALGEYEKCAHIADLTPRWWQEIGLTKLKLNKYVDAEDSFKKSVRLSFTRQDKYLSFLALAEAEINNGQLHAALLNYAQAYLQANKSARFDVLMREGDVSLLLGKFEQAAAKYTEAIKVVPTKQLQIVHRRRRDAFILAHRLDRALNDADKLASLSPDDDENLFVRSQIYARAARRAEALRDLDEVIKANKSSEAGFFHALQADNYYCLGQQKRATEEYELAMRADGLCPVYVSGIYLSQIRLGLESSLPKADLKKPNKDAKNKLATLFGDRMLASIRNELGRLINERWKTLIDLALNSAAKHPNAELNASHTVHKIER